MQVEVGPPVCHVAIVSGGYHDMKPTLLVAVGDHVSLGQALFSDKKKPEILYTSPASGKVDSGSVGNKL